MIWLHLDQHCSCFSISHRCGDLVEGTVVLSVFLPDLCPYGLLHTLLNMKFGEDLWDSWTILTPSQGNIFSRIKKPGTMCQGSPTGQSQVPAISKQTLQTDYHDFSLPHIPPSYKSLHSIEPVYQLPSLPLLKWLSSISTIVLPWKWSHEIS